MNEHNERVVVRERRGAAGAFGTFVGVLFVLCLIVFVCGLLFGWFAIRAESLEVGDHEEWHLTLVVNPQEVEKDFDEAAAKISAMGDDDDDNATVVGTISSIDVTGSSITIATDNRGPVVLRLTDATDIELNDHESLLSELQAGDRVEADTSEDDGAIVVTEIDATRATGIESEL